MLCYTTPHYTTLHPTALPHCQKKHVVLYMAGMRARPAPKRATLGSFMADF